MKQEKRYSKVSVPVAIFEEVKRVIKEYNLLYSSPSEFIIETVRRRLEELKKEHSPCPDSPRDPAPAEDEDPELVDVEQLRALEEVEGW